jgi:hypothetical protein
MLAVVMPVSGEVMEAEPVVPARLHQRAKAGVEEFGFGMLPGSIYTKYQLDNPIVKTGLSTSW